VLQLEVLDLNEMVAGMEDMLRRLIGEHIDLTPALTPELGRVKADPGQLQQVIMNLAVNARDAMPEGGKLIIETANVELDETYTRQYLEVAPGPHVLLALNDTGVGMDAETQAHIFEPFFTTKEVGKGTGLGLAMSYGIIKQSGGHIAVYSEPGRGTTFKVYLPRISEPDTGSEPLLTATESYEGSEVILVVEDEASVRELVYKVLAQKNYTVLQAKNGPEALQRCRQHTGPLHLLLTDVVMPDGINGYELAGQIQSLYPGLKIIYMSGYTDHAILQYGILERGAAFLQKPFSPDSLNRKIFDVLRRS
jgi:CheY-like chemotaxis protein